MMTGPLLNFGDFVGLRAFLTLNNLKFDRITFLQALKSVHVDGRIVNEHIGSTVLADETVTLGIVEPLYFSLKS